jgi:hypothetical protein
MIVIKTCWIYVMVQIHKKWINKLYNILYYYILMKLFKILDFLKNLSNLQKKK